MRLPLLPVLALATALAVPPTARGQDPVAATAPTEASVAETPLGVTYLMQAYSLLEAEARERLALEDQVVALARQVSGDPAFAEVRIEHAPQYRIVVAFADNDQRQALREGLSPQLRRYVQIERTKRSARQLDADIDAIGAALTAAEVEFATSYKHSNSKFVIEVEDNRAAQAARSLIPPALRGDVEVRVGRLPQRQADPTGLRPGDQIQGGHWYYAQASGATLPDCTFAFNVRYNAARTPGILTAGHCNGGVTSGSGEYWHYTPAGNWVRLDPPVIARFGYGTKYDYQVHETTGYAQDAWVYFNNKQNKAGYAANGYFWVTGVTGYYDQKAGMIFCKSGYETGLSCGTISDGAYYWQGAKGWILLTNSTEPRFTDDGDSGSPWFRPPDARGNIVAAGIHSGGDSNCTGRSCRAIFMPIDYIDDHIPVSVMTGPPF